MKRWVAMGALVALGVLPGLSGCKTIERPNVRNTGDVLMSAGFRQLQANTPDRMSDLQTLQPRAISMVKSKRGGRTFFIYPDATFCNCLYVGDGEDYLEYRRLALKRPVGDEKLVSSQLAPDAEMEAMMWDDWWE